METVKSFEIDTELYKSINMDESVNLEQSLDRV